ncbi:MAG TPA: hypothetical protein VNN25_17875 [Thermoanaerobaculia bacterium]|nr:hypothetical protein [Thermoanaerobaculia bacterium]
MIRIAAVAMLLVHVPLAAANTAANFIQQARKSVASSSEAAQAARRRLATLIERDPDTRSGVAVETTKGNPNYVLDNANPGVGNPNPGVGNPNPGVLPIYIVPLDRLREFDDHTVALDILIPANRVYYLVSYPIDSLPPGHFVTLSSVELMNTSVGWKTAIMGGGTYAESVWRTLQNVQQDAILVQIPALALNFIGFSRDGQHLDLSLIAGDSDSPIPERKPYRAEAVLLKLVPLAKRHNGLIN